MKNNVLTVKKKAMSNQTKQINDNLHFKQQEWLFSATHSYLLSSTLPQSALRVSDLKPNAKYLLQPLR